LHHAASEAARLTPNTAGIADPVKCALSIAIRANTNAIG
jgi:hypothetical protein